METKPLLYGVIGFILGGLLVSIAATTFENSEQTSMDSTTVRSLESKTGDDFDSAFISEMIAHHQGAIDMARLSKTRANHQEIKDLSNAIVSAQKQEIKTMQDWQHQWGYATDASSQGGGH